MRKTAVIPALALLLITGCSASADEAEPAAAPAATASSAPSVAPAAPAKDSLEESCRKLLGPGGKGALSQAAYFVDINDGTTYRFEGPVESVRALNGQLQSVALSAPEGMDAQLDDLLSNMERAIDMMEDPANPGAGFNMHAWQDSIAGLQATCAPFEVS